MIDREKTDYDTPINAGMLTKDHRKGNYGGKVNQSMILIKKTAQIDDLDGILGSDSQRDGQLGDTHSRLLLPRQSAEIGIFQTGKFSIVEVIGGGPE